MATEAPPTLIDGPLARTVTGRPTEFWNDSCAVDELAYAVARGATGATSNPTIVLDVLRAERSTWEPRIRRWATEHPEWTETEIAWALIEAMAVRGAGVLAPVFEREDGRAGRLSIQTDPTLYRSTDRMLQQGVRFAGLAPNLQVKFPTTSAGIAAIEAATARGVHINATVCFTVPQAIAVAEAVERGLATFEAGGGDPSTMTPVCTIMMGRLDDWLRAVVARDGLDMDVAALDWAGIAVLKRAVAIYRERGYRTRLLGAAYRHERHWTELVGGDLIMTMPHAWQERFEASGVEPVDRIDSPVDPAMVAHLAEQLPDFRRAYEPDGMTLDEVDRYGATVRTLRTFIASYHELLGAVRDIVLPDPDLPRAG